MYGFTSMLINLLRDERPTHVAVAFDLSRQTWRREEYVEYKATRSTSPSEFNGQVELIKEVLAALRIPWVTAENYEADDVIATLTVRAVAEGMNVKICTGDRDALQLVSDEVTVLYPKRGVSELTRFTPEEVEAKYGLTPLQYPDYAALRGDPSDNLPGIPGVGEKTAAKWIREFGSLTTLVDRVDEVRGKVGDALRENLPNVLINRRLTELVREVPIDDDPATDFPALQYDREAVHRIFDDLQFRVLRERLLETFVQEDETSTEGFEVAGARLAPGTVRAWLAAHATGRVGLVVRGTWAPDGGDVHTLALAAADGAAAVIDVVGADPDDEAALGAWFADKTPTKVGHDLKPAINALTARGWPVDGVACDTALAAYLARPGQATFDLNDLVQRYLHRTLDPDHQVNSEQQLSLIPDEDENTARDIDTRDMVKARAIIDLAGALEEHLDNLGQKSLLADMELPVMTVLGIMERDGIAVDVDYLDDLQSTFAAEAEIAAKAAYAEIGREVNLGSPKQLQVVLFDELNMPKTKRTKTGLHHRRGRAGQPARADRPPVPHPPAPAPRRHPAQDDRRGAAEGGQRRRPHPHHVPADGRRDRAAVQHRAEPAEHPDPDRRGPADPPGLHPRPARRGAADRRLFADRDADHGDAVGGRRADRGVQLRGGPAHRRRGPGVRDPGRAGHAGAAAPDQGDVLRPRLRAVGVRPVRPAEDLRRRREGADGGLLRPVRRDPRLPAAHGRAGQDRGLHRDRLRSPPVRART